MTYEPHAPQFELSPGEIPLAQAGMGLLDNGRYLLGEVIITRQRGAALLFGQARERQGRGRPALDLAHESDRSIYASAATLRLLVGELQVRAELAGFDTHVLIPALSEAEAQAAREVLPARKLYYPLTDGLVAQLRVDDRHQHLEVHRWNGQHWEPIELTPEQRARHLAAMPPGLLLDVEG